MRSFALASGSSGNCFYLESDSGIKVLIDLGLSFKRIKEILFSRNIDIKDIDAVFITHEHSDHCQGLVNFEKNVDCDIYISKGTFSKLKFKSESFKFLKNHSHLKISDLSVLALEKPHDTQEALAFVFECSGKKIGFFTDMGYVKDEFRYILKGLDVVYFEANYCEGIIKEKRKLMNGNYVGRLFSDSGHLSISDSCNILCEVAQNNQKIVLSHISENTNTYENAYSKIKNALFEADRFPEILVSFQGEPTDWIE